MKSKIRTVKVRLRHCAVTKWHLRTIHTVTYFVGSRIVTFSDLPRSKKNQKKNPFLKAITTLNGLLWQDMTAVLGWDLRSASARRRTRRTQQSKTTIRDDQRVRHHEAMSWNRTLLRQLDFGLKSLHRSLFDGGRQVPKHNVTTPVLLLRHHIRWDEWQKAWLRERK